MDIDHLSDKPKIITFQILSDTMRLHFKTPNTHVVTQTYNKITHIEYYYKQQFKTNNQR